MGERQRSAILRAPAQRADSDQCRGLKAANGECLPAFADRVTRKQLELAAARAADFVVAASLRVGPPGGRPYRTHPMRVPGKVERLVAGERSNPAHGRPP